MMIMEESAKNVCKNALYLYESSSLHSGIDKTN